MARDYPAAPQQASYNFYGMDLQDLLGVEVCAGSARLTKTVRSKGMKGLAGDKTKGTELRDRNPVA